MPMQRKKNYAVVKFINEQNAVETVPSAWIHGQGSLCWWPNEGTDEKTIKNYIVTREAPNPKTWQVVEIEKVAKAATFLRAQIKANRYLDTSNISSGSSTDDMPQRKHHGSSAKSSRKKVCKKLPEPPKTLTTVEANNHLDNNSSDSTNCDFVVRADDDDGIVPVSKDVHKRRSQCLSLNLETQYPSIQFSHSPGSALNTSTPDQYKDNSSISQCVKRLIVLHEKTLAEIKEVRKVQDNIFEAIRKLDPSQVRSATCQLDAELSLLSQPLQTIEDLNIVENLLIDKEMSNKLAAYLAQTTPGSDAKAMTRGVMLKLFSKCLSLKFSFCGRQKKNPFKELRLSGVVFDAVSRRYPDSCNIIKDKIGVYLAGASDRDGGRINRVTKPSAAESED